MCCCFACCCPRARWLYKTRTFRGGEEIVPVKCEESRYFEYTLGPGSYTLSGAVADGCGVWMVVNGDVTLTLDNVTINGGYALYLEGDGRVTLELEGTNTLTSAPTEQSDNVALLSHIPVTIQDADNDGSLRLIGAESGEYDGNCAHFEKDLTLLTRNVVFDQQGDSGDALTLLQNLTCGGGFGLIGKYGLEDSWSQITDSGWHYAKAADWVKITYEGMAYEENVLAGVAHWVEYYDGEWPEGKVFSHWLTQDGEKLAEGERILPKKDMTLTPVFADAVEIVWIDRGEEVMHITVPMGSVAKCPEVDYSEEGVFTGWKVSDVNAVLKSGQLFIADRHLTFIAQYEPQEMVEVKLLEGLTGQVIYLPKGKPWKVNRAGRDGEGVGTGTFVGWRTESGELIQVGKTLTPQEDMILWAEYREITDTVTINIHDTNDGEKEEEPRTVGGYISLYQFNWYEDKNLSKIVLNGVTYGPEDYILVTDEMEGKTLTLYYEKQASPVRIPLPNVNLPQTGDSSRLALWLALTGLAGAGMMLLRRKARG